MATKREPDDYELGTLAYEIGFSAMLAQSERARINRGIWEPRPENPHKKNKSGCGYQEWQVGYDDGMEIWFILDRDGNSNLIDRWHKSLARKWRRVLKEM